MKSSFALSIAAAAFFGAVTFSNSSQATNLGGYEPSAIHRAQFYGGGCGWGPCGGWRGGYWRYGYRFHRGYYRRGWGYRGWGLNTIDNTVVQVAALITLPVQALVYNTSGAVGAIANHG